MLLSHHNSTCTSSSTFGLYALGPLKLRRHHAMKCFLLNHELVEFEQCGCVQAYIIMENRCLYPETRRKMSRMSTQNALRTEHIYYSTLNFPPSLTGNNTHSHRPWNEQTTVHESYHTVTYDVFLTLQPFKASCAN